MLQGCLLYTSVLATLGIEDFGIYNVVGGLDVYKRQALAFCRDRGLEFYAVNRDYPEEEKGRNNHYSRKLKADLFIDDRNLGGLPDWGTIYGMIHDGTTFSDLIRNAGESPVSENHGRGLFSRLFGR